MEGIGTVLEDFGTRTFFYTKVQDHLLTFNQCLPYFDSFTLSVCSDNEFDLWPVHSKKRFRASCLLFVQNRYLV